MEDWDGLNHEDGPGGKGKKRAQEVAQHLIRTCDRVDYLSLPDFWRTMDQSKKQDISDWIELSRKVHADIAIAAKLMETVLSYGTPPPEALFADAVHVGVQGGMHLIQLTIAERLVRYERLLNCASRWWQYRSPVQHNSGKWVSFANDVPVKRMIVEALRPHFPAAIESRDAELNCKGR